MTFNPNIPQPNELISQSQAEIQTNFSQSDTAFGVDHTAFSVLANQGQHKQVTLIAPIANPNQAGNISSIYTKTSGTGVELFYQHGTANLGVSQLTGGGITAAAWVLFDPAGNIPAGGSFNVTSVGLSTSIYTVNFTRNFATTAYAAVSSFDLSGVAGVNVCGLDVTGQAVGTYSFRVRNPSGGFIAPTLSYLVFFGVLA